MAFPGALAAGTLGQLGAGGAGLAGLFGGGLGGAGGAGGSPILDLLKNLKVDIRRPGGGGFSFSGGGQDAERRQLLERLFSILQGPQRTASASTPRSIRVGGTQPLEFITPMAEEQGFSLNQPIGNLSRFFRP